MPFASHLPNAAAPVVPSFGEQLGGDGSGLTTFEFRSAADASFLMGVVVAMEAGDSYAAHTESWYTSHDLLEDLLKTEDIQLVKTYAGSWGGLGNQILAITSVPGVTLMLTAAQNPSADKWTRFSARPAPDARAVYHGIDSGRPGHPRVGMAVEIESGKLESVTWVQATQANDLFANVPVGTPSNLRQCAIGSSNDENVRAALSGHCGSDDYWYNSK